MWQEDSNRSITALSSAATLISQLENRPTSPPAPSCPSRPPAAQVRRRGVVARLHFHLAARHDCAHQNSSAPRVVSGIQGTLGPPAPGPAGLMRSPGMQLVQDCDALCGGPAVPAVATAPRAQGWVMIRQRI